MSFMSFMYVIHIVASSTRHNTGGAASVRITLAVRITQLRAKVPDGSDSSCFVFEMASSF